MDVRVSVTGRPGRRGEEVAVTVADSGPGIEPEDLPHVTEKFYRAARNPLGGLGLGLWISKEIVEAHGGELSAVSGPGQGTAQPSQSRCGPRLKLASWRGHERRPGGPAAGRRAYQ